MISQTNPNIATRARICVPARLISVEIATSTSAMMVTLSGVEATPSSVSMNGPAPTATAAMVVNSAQP